MTAGLRQTSFVVDPDLARVWALALEADLSVGFSGRPTAQHCYISSARSVLRGLDCDLDRLIGVSAKALAVARSRHSATGRGTRPGKTLGGPAVVVRLCMLALPVVMDAERRGTLEALRADLRAGDPWTRTPPGTPFSPIWAVPAT